MAAAARAEAQGRLDGAPALWCALPSCGRPLPAPRGRGRPRAYCDDRNCQTLARRQREAAARQVKAAYTALRQLDPGPLPVLDPSAADAAAEAVDVLRALAQALEGTGSDWGWTGVAAGSARRVAGRLAAHLPGG